jgi:hypothetical protein
LHRPVGELETSMTHRELMEWHRFEATVSPLPDRLADIHSAMLCALVVNVAGAAGSSPITASDFFVIKDPPPEPLDDGLTEAERAAVSWRASGG